MCEPTYALYILHNQEEFEIARRNLNPPKDITNGDWSINNRMFNSYKLDEKKLNPYEWYYASNIELCKMVDGLTVGEALDTLKIHYRRTSQKNFKIFYKNLEFKVLIKEISKKSIFYYYNIGGKD